MYVKTTALGTRWQPVSCIRMAAPYVNAAVRVIMTWLAGRRGIVLKRPGIINGIYYIETQNDHEESHARQTPRP